MDIIGSSTTKRKSAQAKTPLHSCYARHKEPSPLDRFLGIAYRKHGHGLWKSTRTIGVTLFHTLRKGPRIVNVSQLARDTGYSTRTVNKALAYFSRFGKIQRIHERHTGKRRPCMYKLHASFTEKQESSKPQEKARCGVSGNRIKALESKINHTTKKSSFSLESYKNMPKTLPLMPRDKKKLLAIARKTCQPDVVSFVLDILWQRDPVAGVWLSAIRGLQDLTVDAQPEEIVWRARKAIAALIGGITVEKYQAIMQGETDRLGEIDRRLVGLHKWGQKHGVTSWYVEKRASLERLRNDAEWDLSRDRQGNATGFLKTINEPQPQSRRPRGRFFHVSEYYTAKRQPLEGEALEKRKAMLVKALMSESKTSARRVSSHYKKGSFRTL